MLTISLLLASTGLFTGLYLREKRKAKEKLRSLEEINNIYLDTVKQISTQEVRSEIGQNLHDELSSSLAGIVHHMEYLSKRTEDEGLKKQMQVLSVETERVYEIVRGKSHELFHQANDNNHFEDNVYRILDLLIPTPQIHREIDICPKVAGTLALNQRIELLRIIQEIITNTLKHGKQVSEIFVFLYENDKAQAVLQVGDNGKDAQLKEKEGLGMLSIRKRVQLLNAELVLETKEGVAYTITLPRA
jgi:signal transduction histidine kinase